MFSRELLDHFEHPRNAGELPGATVRVQVGNPVCGDILQLAAIVDGGVIREVRFLCRGCTASIACGSLLTELIEGRSLRGLEITADLLSEALGDLPAASFHAAQLGRDGFMALLRAVEEAD
jgi:nitrogen fixation protein NifU and related proteins